MKKLVIISVILGALLASAPVLSQKKATQPNVDPEFQKFWKEFVKAAESRDKEWFEQNSLFPIVNLGQCGLISYQTPKEEFLVNFDVKSLKKIKFNKKSFKQYQKTAETFPSEVDENGNYIDLAQHIPNGSLVIEVGYKYGICWLGFSFAKVNGCYYFFSEGSCCEAD